MPNRYGFFVLVLAFLGATLVTTKPAARSDAAEEKVRFSVAAITGSYMDEFVAIEKGYHRDRRPHRGDDPGRRRHRHPGPHRRRSSLQHLGGLRSQLPCCAARRSKWSTPTSIAPAINYGRRNPRSKHLKDLIGKRVGVTSRGDTQELSVRLLLRKHGIDANSVVYMAVGFGGARARRPANRHRRCGAVGCR